MSEPMVVASSNALPTTANGSSTPVFTQRSVTGGGAGGGGAGGTFGVKTGLAQMLKGG